MTVGTKLEPVVSLSERCVNGRVGRLSTMFRGYQYPNEFSRLESFYQVVPGERIELSLPCENWILSPTRLPVPPSRHEYNFGGSIEDLSRH